MNLVKWLFGQTCSHQFAWPRNDRSGRHYQICLSCGTAYEYDWMNMRRTKRQVGHELQRRNGTETASNLLRSLVAGARNSAGDQVSGAHS